MGEATSEPIRVLLADDHPGVRQAVADLLRASGDFAVVASCRDGAEAVAAARATHPDVAVLDLTMPELDGLAAMRALHQEQPDLPVVVLTAATEVDVVAAVREAGAAGMVLKGVDPASLPAQLRAVLRGAPVWPTHDAHDGR